MIRSTGPVAARSVGVRTSPCMNSTPPARNRSSANSDPRRFRLSKATTDAAGRSRLNASAMFDPTNPAPPVTRMRSAMLFGIPHQCHSSAIHQLELIRVGGSYKDGSHLCAGIGLERHYCSCYLFSMDLIAIYQERFTKTGLGKRDQVWKALCRSFFDPLIGSDKIVLDLACGYGEFI